MVPLGLSTGQIVALEDLTRRIFVLHGQRVMLSTDLADLYDVEPKALMQAVRRNLKRFPADFMFQLTRREFADLRSHSVTANSAAGKALAKADQRIFARCGMKVDSRNPRAWDELMRMGVRIEATHLVDAEHAWLAVTGRNLDGTLYRYSEYWVRIGGEWKSRSPTYEKETATLPTGWPPSIDDFEARFEASTNNLNAVDSSQTSSGN